MEESRALDLAESLCNKAASIKDCLNLLRGKNHLFDYTITNHENMGITVIKSHLGVLRLSDLAYDNPNNKKGEDLKNLMVVILQNIY